MPIKLTTINSFGEKFIKNNNEFKWSKNPVRIYPISVLQKHLTIPFPLIKTELNILIFVQSGKLTTQIDTTKIELKSNAITFISAGTIHSLLSAQKTTKGFVILIENKVFNAIFNKETILNLSLIQPVLNLTKVEGLWTENVCELLYEETNKENPNRKIGSGLLQALLYKTLELSDSHKTLSRSEQIAIRFKHLVEAHFIEHKSVQFYANTLAISPNYLNRCVQNVFHKAAKEIINETAIVYSQLLIMETSKDIAEVCYELNFEDPSYFSRIFKKITGKTPTEYRKFTLHDLS